jgi:hypothetical protein
MTIHHDEPLTQPVAMVWRPLDAGPRRGREVTAPLGTAGTGHLAIASDVNGLALSGDGSMPDLLQARFEGQIPETSCGNGLVTIRYPRFSVTNWISGPFRPTSTAAIVLNGSIPWRIEIEGGVAALASDLRGVRLSDLCVGGGASRSALLLPHPSGAVPVRFGGGVSQLTIHRPHIVPVRLTVRGGAVCLALDRQHAGAIGGVIRWESDDFDGARDFYEIEIDGGARELTIDGA